MNIQLNGQLIRTQAHNLSELLCERQIDMNYIAAACNGIFVPKNKYHQQILEEGYQIELLSPMQGG